MAVLREQLGEETHTRTSSSRSEGNLSSHLPKDEIFKKWIMADACKENQQGPVDRGDATSMPKPRQQCARKCSTCRNSSSTPLNTDNILIKR